MSAVARIALVGPMGVGKTTAIRTLCGRTTVDCDVPNLDRGAHAKATTTVGADFGEWTLDNGERLHIYGCPGQERFDFVREWVLTLSAGVFVMTDLHAPGAVQDAVRLLSEVCCLHSAALSAVLVARPASRAMLEDFRRRSIAGA